MLVPESWWAVPRSAFLWWWKGVRWGTLSSSKRVKSPKATRLLWLCSTQLVGYSTWMTEGVPEPRSSALPHPHLTAGGLMWNWNSFALCMWIDLQAFTSPPPTCLSLWHQVKKELKRLQVKRAAALEGSQWAIRPSQTISARCFGTSLPERSPGEGSNPVWYRSLRHPVPGTQASTNPLQMDRISLDYLLFYYFTLLNDHFLTILCSRIYKVRGHLN